VRPILADACFACHGFDAKSRKAKLRLDTPEGAFALAQRPLSHQAGDLKQSEVWNRITSAAADSVMPPPEHNKQLTGSQKETIRLWIAQGAKYQKHWSFEPIQRRSFQLLTRAEGKVPGNPIDNFLLARLVKEGLKPTPEADRGRSFAACRSRSLGFRPR